MMTNCLHHRHGFVFGVVFLFLCHANNVAGCFWDTETLLQERARIPSALEIILGKFPHHTAAYYQWRLDDRLKKLDRDADNDLLWDDVAVSYEKLGRYEEAIEVATNQLERNPNRYESLANLGTFLIHDGKLEKGLQFIEQAIKVNPDAHFGREKYQLILVKYLLSNSHDAEFDLPLAETRFDDDRHARYRLPFRDFLAIELTDGTQTHLSKDQLKEAVTGILGMMRFSRHDSPILLEVLGELQETLSARQLAYRAYMSASFQVDDPKAKKRYEKLASNVLEFQLESWEQIDKTKIMESDIAKHFRAERLDAAEWYETLKTDEERWIRHGDAVDEKFNEKYRGLPEAIATDPPIKPPPNNHAYPNGNYSRLVNSFIPIAVIIAGMIVTVVVFVARQRRLAH